MFCQGKSLKHTLCAVVESDSVLTQAKLPLDLGDCGSGIHLSPNPDQGFEQYHKLANVPIETNYSLEAVSVILISVPEVLKPQMRPADKTDAVHSCTYQL